MVFVIRGGTAPISHRFPSAIIPAIPDGLIPDDISNAQSRSILLRELGNTFTCVGHDINCQTQTVILGIRAGTITADVHRTEARADLARCGLHMRLNVAIAPRDHVT